MRSLKATGALARLPPFALIMLASIAVHAEPISSGRGELQVAELLVGPTPSNPWRMDAFAPAVDVASQAAGVRTFGRLVLRAGLQPVGFRVLHDTYGAADAPAASVRRLPSGVQVDLVQDGNALIPQTRTPIAGSHPYWEFAFGVGRTWHEPGDGDWTRAALPFSLIEVNANYLHHGVLTFVFAPTGRISHVAFQVSSETCAYFKADLWGFLQAELLDVTLPDADRVVEARRAELGGRLPRRSLAQLAVDHPGADPTEFGHPAEVTPSQMSTWGVIVDGIHYSGGCPTRAGEYPFCEELVLPSYSVAKSVFGSLGLMRLEKRFPGARNQKVVDYVPECAVNGGWSGVTFGNLLDMSSGHWTSAAAYADESSVAMAKNFFDEPRHAGKIAYACGHSPRRETAGLSFVYRTSDTYVLGAALAAFVRKKMGPQADLLDDVVWPDVWRVAGLSPVADFSRRTRDDVQQPFVGFGLTLLPDDVAKLGQWLNPLSASARDLLDERMLRSALQLDATDRGLATTADGTLLYNDGFWAVRIDDLPSCDAPVFVPYMSGFGGISIALLPNGVTYYYFSDGNEFRFRRAVYAAAQIHPYCRTATASPAVMPKDPRS
ncbi:MAG: hypothetical protein NTU56_11425 [Proteobacteria bacterium]|nr:hypothetical protein [Pseudomonadota bacterium]